MCLVLLAGCARLAGSIAADTLSAAILDQDDPELVASGVPAYLLLVDGLIARNGDDPALLAAGAQLFALYGSRFAETPERAVALTAKARRYGARALCLAHEPACDWDGLDYDAFVQALQDVGRKDIDALFAYAVGWLAHLDATSEDWTAVAELPWVQAALERVLELDESYREGTVHGYLGTLYALRPPALGGRPEEAQRHFERAIELSHGRDLSLKVEYARRYARLVFDQELHDRLLNEVLNAAVEAPGLTLFNVLAKQEARGLLATSKEYF
ncbi:MAG TPA: TRAP transporter TatT component family protein [Gammaproteobacteria bacterium]